MEGNGGGFAFVSGLFVGGITVECGDNLAIAVCILLSDDALFLMQSANAGKLNFAYLS